MSGRTLVLARRSFLPAADVNPGHPAARDPLPRLFAAALAVVRSGAQSPVRDIRLPRRNLLRSSRGAGQGGEAGARGERTMDAREH
jgi:hypothetical protein